MNDFNVTITTGRSRFDKNWRPETMAWSEFVARCKDVRITPETAAEYAAMNKEQQGNVKDVGGFIGALLKGTARKKSAVAQRTMVTLDLDSCEGVAVADIVRRIESSPLLCAAVIYSTHKHKDASPRLRAVVPLEYAVDPETYEAVARKAAERFGVLDLCDATTFETARLFYWPSCSRDAPYVCRQIEGPQLKPHDVLALYGSEWTDRSQWPTAPGEGKQLPAEAGGDGRPAEDPLTKDGIIGAFCRAHYPIGQAIEELLPDVYTRGKGGRYSIIGGTTANGVIVYDDRWVYSSHNSDPARLKLCNIYDLVRIHLYGDTKESHRKMCDYAADDEATKMQLHKERMADFEGFDAEPDGTECDGASWAAGIEVDKKTGEPTATGPNIVYIMENDPKLKGLWRYNTFAERIELTRPAPWGTGPGRWQDSDESDLRLYMESRYKIVAEKKIRDAFVSIGTKLRYHPVRDYLDSLPEWDGVPRLDNLFIDYLGAEDTLLNKAIARLMVTAMVARVMYPGMKFDNVCVLYGPEGIGKSTVIAKLGGEWFSDSINTIDGKTSVESLLGVWVAEMAEMIAAKRSENEMLKAFVSTQVDRFRPAYGRNVVERPRQCVIFCTTNEDTFLKGMTGNRRMLPVVCTGKDCAKDFTKLEQERDQIFAEAKRYVAPDMRLALRRDLDMEARKYGEQFNEDIIQEDTLAQQIAAWLEIPVPLDWETWTKERRQGWFKTYEADDPNNGPTYLREWISIPEIVTECCNRNLSDDSYKYLARKIGRIMKSMEGWEEPKPSRHCQKIYGIQKAYRRKT